MLSWVEVVVLALGLLLLFGTGRAGLTDVRRRAARAAARTLRANPMAARNPVQLVWVELRAQLLEDARERATRLIADLIDQHLAYESRWGDFPGVDRRHPSLVEPNPFHVLGLPDGATVDEVRARHRALARQLHPDGHPDASPERRAEIEDRLKVVNAAHDALRAATAARS